MASNSAVERASNGFPLGDLNPIVRETIRIFQALGVQDWIVFERELLSGVERRAVVRIVESAIADVGEIGNGACHLRLSPLGKTVADCWKNGEIGPFIKALREAELAASAGESTVAAVAIAAEIDPPFVRSGPQQIARAQAVNNGVKSNDIPPTDAVREMFALIRDSPVPLSGKELANNRGVSEATITRHFIPKLKALGVKNRRGSGYYLPDSAK